MNREREIDLLFSNTIRVFEEMFSARLRLSEEEAEAFKEGVFTWFDRFTRRPGNEYVPVERLQIPLLSGACGLARDLAEPKGIRIPILSADPVVVARKLGLVRAAEKKGPEL